MIIVKLSGGLGNQLFQYALGRNLALRNSTTLCFDTSYYSQFPLRRYQLDAYRIKAKILSADELQAILPQKENLFGKIMKKISGKSYRVYHEKEISFDASILECSDFTILEGYWQSEKYFKEAEKTIREELVLKENSTPAVNSFLERIKMRNTVSVHVRRGDYATNPETNMIHGTLGIDYYLEAMEWMRNKLKDPVFIIFSDDMDWVKNNLPQGKEIMYGESGTNAEEDMMLMSKCAHHIIANSSFSWWGAWLNSSKEKHVLCPIAWFSDSKRNSKDIIPQTWISI